MTGSELLLQQLLKHQKSEMILTSTSTVTGTSQQHSVRITNLRARASTFRAVAILEEQDTRHEAERLRQARTSLKIDLNESKFKYNEHYSYKKHRNILFDLMAIL